MQLSDLKQYNYSYPETLVAQTPLIPRDSSKLMVYDTATNTITHTVFAKINDFLPPKAALVLNTTSVIPARLTLAKSTGGLVEVLFLLNESNQNTLLAVINRPVKDGEILYHEGVEVIKIVSKQDSKYTVVWLNIMQINRFLDAFGTTPLPPYIKENTQSESEKRTEYQSLFAEKSLEYNSVAAPTASLHFTEELLESIKTSHPVIELKLHVGLGTFAKLKQHNFDTKSLHKEWISISTDMMTNLKAQEYQPLIAVGTTALRSLESLESLKLNTHSSLYEGWTELFLYPPHQFGHVTGLITNFHVPESSLLLLVDAFLQDKQSKKTILELYAIAIKQEYRLFSFGDAMLIL